MRTKLIVLFCLALLLLGLFIAEERRVARILEAQRMEQERISTEYTKALERIGEDLENGLLTHEEAMEMMLEEHNNIQEKNVEIFERTLDKIVPDE